MRERNNLAINDYLGPGPHEAGSTEEDIQYNTVTRTLHELLIIKKGSQLNDIYRQPCKQ